MALLMALHFDTGGWDVAVVDRLTMRMVAGDRTEIKDVLGRSLPCFDRFEAREGIAKDEAVRLANELKGLSLEHRQAAYAERAPALRLVMSGG